MSVKPTSRRGRVYTYLFTNDRRLSYDRHHMGPGWGLGRAQREKFRRLGYLFGDAVARDENHGRVDRPEVYKHNGRAAHRYPHLFEDFVYIAC